MSNEPAPLPPRTTCLVEARTTSKMAANISSSMLIPLASSASNVSSFLFQVSEKDTEAITNYKLCSKCSLTRETESKGLTNEAREAARCARAAQAQLSFKTGSKPMVDVTNYVVGPSMLDTKINRMVKQINLRWTEYDGHELALLAKHYELCFEDNFCIAPEASTQNIEGLYQFYANHSNCQMALGQDNAKHTKGLTRGTYMNIEVVVDSSKEEEDEESAQGKRKAGSNSHDQLIKRIKQSGNSAGTRGFTGWVGAPALLALTWSLRDATRMLTVFQQSLGTHAVHATEPWLRGRATAQLGDMQAPAREVMDVSRQPHLFVLPSLLDAVRALAVVGDGQFNDTRCIIKTKDYNLRESNA
ncbi:hypothetical protein B0H17DRAFT_1279279 [Mycena rosella]|uniref:Uncharacterized protein n=1 Tax=Mycena rosella TaxID=1033263 RepID=A0AAD7DJQ2_MYCRO|nr:hypothetical protein B0H17DRAFT_1279279 [Mycena rosella]